METQYLRTLVSVVETGSFSKAANDLCITQSAVSQRIRFLEDRYGFSLLDRSGTGTKPTEPGRIILEKARHILALEKQMEMELANLGKKKRLSLGCTPTFGVVYLPKVLNRFFLANSDDIDFKFALNTPELSLKGLLQSDCDISVIEHCDPIVYEELVAQPLPPDELVFISAPALDLPEEVSLEQLLLQRIIARREGCSSRCLLQDNLRRFGHTIEEFRGIMIYDDLHLTIQTVLAGSGVAFVSRSLVEEQIMGGHLRGHVVPGFYCFRSRTALVHRSRKEDVIIRNFIDSVVAAFNF